MLDNAKSADEMLGAALGPGAECPTLEQIEQPKFVGHVSSCAYCKSELELLHSFESNELDPSEAAQVSKITQRLRERSAEIFPVQERPGLWAGVLEFFTMPKLVPVAMSMAALLVVVAVGMQMRNGTAPNLLISKDGPEVMRATQLAVVSPVGDQDSVPRGIEWNAVPGAAKYAVRLVEVDGNELWKGEADGTRIELPAAAQGLIVPAKTILCEVSARNASGVTLVTSEVVRFRLRSNADRQ